MPETLDVTAVAEAVAEATGSSALTVAATATATNNTLTITETVPNPLPTGWILKESRSHPGCFYYFYIPTGLASWHAPVEVGATTTTTTTTGMATAMADTSLLPVPLEQSESVTRTPPQQLQIQQRIKEEAPNTMNRYPIESTENTSVPTENDPEDADDRSSKRRKPATTSGPKEVRVLHILKKHKDSRRPSSWRQAKITSTLKEAKEELEGLLEILLEEEGNFDELKATFEELARTESDCSSAKRGGDLGFFGRRKMQPPFEEASFALEIGELTKEVVETSSGVHLILRIG